LDVESLLDVFRGLGDGRTRCADGWSSRSDRPRVRSVVLTSKPRGCYPVDRGLLCNGERLNFPKSCLVVLSSHAIRRVLIPRYARILSWCSNSVATTESSGLTEAKIRATSTTLALRAGVVLLAVIRLGQSADKRMNQLTTRTSAWSISCNLVSQKPIHP
jgi:hypothetical protein